MPPPTDRTQAEELSLARRFVRRLTSQRAIVEDDSMRPTLEPGDRLRVDARAYRSSAPAPGDLVVLHDPERPGHLLVKRVVVREAGPVGEGGPVGPGEIRVEGDDPASRDSRAFGPVRPDRIVGRVWSRYYPAERRRRFPP